MSNIQINYSKSCEKFFAKNQHIFTEDKSDILIVKAVKKIVYNCDENIDIKRLKGTLAKQYRIRFGKIRIIFLLSDGVVTVVDVQDIDFGGNVY